MVHMFSWCSPGSGGGGSNGIRACRRQTRCFLCEVMGSCGVRSLLLFDVWEMRRRVPLETPATTRRDPSSPPTWRVYRAAKVGLISFVVGVGLAYLQLADFPAAPTVHFVPPLHSPRLFHLYLE